ncbi:histidine--tRNA ligase [Pelomonas sp. CA6]|uniref:histidine--tRNA ligase n=1 Tax=Pelomonas sp. CA6 TaxID=2907999 RepID=UPI001F4AA9F1|nr:histidine--tRNA ligase [Pelomonas sp. CA6]MCH7342139.1 histidine--tRNA ligase [Pelomonas sp. CA6]
MSENNKPDATRAAKLEPLRGVKGMNDSFAPESARWEWLEGQMRGLLAAYGYRNARTPIVEPTQLFVRGIGEVTDIVEKEMYTFTDKLNGDQLALRPEITAGLVRAVIEHNALYDGPLRLWSIGPVFRHERPQKGRYRQFHQLDVEAMGFAGPDIDAELILLTRALWKRLGLKEGEDIRLELNSLGEPAERAAHRAALIAYLEQHQALLDEDAKRRLYTNPLRVLDTKNPAMQAMVEGAPKLLDFLGEDSRAHLQAICTVLDAAGLAYTINPRLVRGLDYYNRTVFEWVTPHLGSQATVCGGGRYDGLIAQLGGKPAPAVGFGLGMERLLLLLEALGLNTADGAPDAYAVIPDATQLPRILPVLEALREQGVAVQMHAGGGSFKSQFKKADASGARYALVFGGDELARGEVALKPLREEGAAQVTRPLADVGGWAQELQNRRNA